MIIMLTILDLDGSYYLDVCNYYERATYHILLCASTLNSVKFRRFGQKQKLAALLKLISTV